MTTAEASGMTVASLPEVVKIVESRKVGRWVLAEIVTGSLVSFELTFAPNITKAEWEAFRRELPVECTVYQLETVGGQLLGIRSALRALIA